MAKVKKLRRKPTKGKNTYPISSGGAVTLTAGSGGAINIDAGSVTHLTGGGNYEITSITSSSLEKEDMELDKEIRAFRLGPVLSQYIQKDEVDSFLIGVVRTLMDETISEYTRRFWTPVEILLHKDDCVVVLLPSVNDLIQKPIKFTPLNYLFSHFVMMDTVDYQNFRSDLEHKLVELATEGSDE
jgi:hypothetical protein